MNLRAAFGKLDITPTLEMKGSYRLAPDGHALGVHDPVYARWMLLEQGKTRWCQIVLDVVLLRNEQACRWRERIAAVVGLHPDWVTVSCTHTHNGPDLPNEWGHYDHEWEADLIERISGQIAEKSRRLEPAVCAWAETQYDGVVNRHTHFLAKAIADGNADVINSLDESDRERYENASGPTDPTLTVFRVDRAEGGPLGHLVHFSGHCTTAMGCGRLLSADYPAWLLRETEANIGGVGIFVQGTCGNINLEVGERNYEHAERHGTAMGRLAAEVLRSVDTRSPSDPLCVAATTFQSSVRADMRKQEEVRREMDELTAKQEQYEKDHPHELVPQRIWNPIRALRMELASLSYLKDKPTLPVHAQHVRLAGRSLLITPGEWFVEFGLKLREDHAGLRPIWIGYSNGNIAYVPTAKAWAEPGYMGRRFYPINALARGEGERLYGVLSEWMRSTL